ncbi:MAG: squalene synthase HpnC [Mariprofundaceae bacterium]
MQKITLEQSYQYCSDLARKHYENFPTASRLIHPELRPAVAAIYAFARMADDIADEGESDPENRLKQLNALETLLERCPDQELEHSVFLALGDAIRKHQLPTQALHDLLTAFRMDISLHAYDSEQELLFYCRHSANPVGRLMLALHSINQAQALAASDALCTALQLANFWQDLSVDLPRGRYYLPKAWLSKVGLNNEDLLSGNVSNELIREALEPAIQLTREMFRKGRALLILLPFRLRLQISLTRRGGMAILNAVARSTSPLEKRPVLSFFSWLRIAPLAFIDCLICPCFARKKIAS